MVSINNLLGANATIVLSYSHLLPFFVFMKFELEQDNYLKDKNYGEMVSTTKKDDLNPV